MRSSPAVSHSRSRINDNQGAADNSLVIEPCRALPSSAFRISEVLFSLIFEMNCARNPALKVACSHNATIVETSARPAVDLSSAEAAIN
jgi:hypothetical protein